MENFGLGGGATLLGVFLLCTCVGIIAGNYIKSQTGTANASSANITVVNNNQISTIDQGTGAILRTSTVTIKDTTATLGYHLSAQITQNTITGSTATIYPTTPPQSPTTSPCTQSSPCTLNPSTPTQILETTNTSATQPQGHTTQWTVTITLPRSTPQGNYLLDIAYTEDPILPPPGPPEPNPSTPTTYGAMQKMTNAQCSTTRGTAFDARNGQTYYIQKIGNLCWMETNLRYAGYDGTGEQWNSVWNYPDDRYATTTALATATASLNDNTRPLTTVSGSQASSYTVAQRADPGGSTTLDTTTPTNNTTFYGYLYNWCAAMGGQANACNNTSTTGIDTTQSICPAGWRLPTGSTGGEFQVLNTAINSGSATSDAGLRNNFLAVYSGRYSSYLSLQGSHGYYWSSTVLVATHAFLLFLLTSNVSPGTGNTIKDTGFAVRCVL